MWGAEVAGMSMDCGNAAPHGLHILLAEDDSPSLCIINRMLTHCGYQGVVTWHLPAVSDIR